VAVELTRDDQNSVSAVSSCLWKDSAVGGSLAAHALSIVAIVLPFAIAKTNSKLLE
jgi:hypothetical protein